MECPRTKSFRLRSTCVLLFFFCVASFPAWAQQKPPDGASAAPTPAKERKVTEMVYGHENWSSITLDGTTLIAQPPVQAPGIGDAPQNTFIRELYRLQWRPNDPIDLYVILPKNVSKPPVVLYLYSYPQDTDRFKDDRWCTTVTSGGYAAVGFVSALTGHRFHDRPMKEWFVSDLQESLAASAHDVQMILNYLATRTDVDMQRVGMFGQGSGGAIAILASAADPRIKVLDIVQPWADWPDWLAKSKVVPENERTAYLKPEFLSGVAPLDPVQWLPKVKAESIRIQDVRTDPVNPVQAQERLEAAAPARAEVEQFGDQRAFYPAAAGGKIFDWMKTQVQMDGKTSAANMPGAHYHPPLGDVTSATPTRR